jgi:hypothetical protein
MWNIPPAKEVLSDQILDFQESQELLLSAYVEEQDKWNKDLLDIERETMGLNKIIKELAATKDKWWKRLWHKIRSKPTPRQQLISQLQDRLDKLHEQYLKRIVEQPNVDRFEIGMFCGKLLKGK